MSIMTATALPVTAEHRAELARMANSSLLPHRKVVQFNVVQAWDNDQFGVVFDRWLAAGKSVDALTEEVASIARIIATLLA